MLQIVLKRKKLSCGKDDLYLADFGLIKRGHGTVEGHYRLLLPTLLYSAFSFIK